MAENHAETLAGQRERLDEIRRYLDIETKRGRLEELRGQASAPGLWDDPDHDREVTTRLSRIEEELETYDTLADRLDDLAVLNELAQEEDDEDAAAEVRAGVAEVTAMLDRLELATLLAGEDDLADAIVSVDAGEGGVDAMDWAQMLQRMYLRWASDRGYGTEVYDETFGDEAGVKSTTFEVRGHDAYGLLACEHGVHRLVRQSPFDADSRRHTSFAKVDVVPVLPDLDEEIEVDDEDLRVETYRASGPGGQSVNTTDSAVRLTHQPTGIVVSCQNEKSQHQNRAAAMRVLRAKLAERRRQERREELDAIRGSRGRVGFGSGSKVRSYVLHPYQTVKDERTGHEEGNPEAVLDGELDEFIEAELRRRAAEQQEPEAAAPAG